MRAIIAAFKLLLFALWSVLIVPLQCLLLVFHKGKYAYILPYYWHKGVCAIFRLQVRIEGTPQTSGQIIYVSNHLSYLDIPVIGTVLKASFVAKKDVASWPVFGFLSKLQQTAFIDRNRNAARKEAGALDSMIEAQKSLILFPEGTSTDGKSVLPFKSSLFSLALKDAEKPLSIQPFTIEMIEINKQNPETQNIVDLYAWHRDMTTELPAHLWRFAKSKGAVIGLHFHPLIAADAYSDRKKLALLCHEAVSSLYTTSKKIAA
ncbi:MAG: lysophospholipid acyltransferase family protein [Alphaproteobacteria bacterium]